MIDYKLTVIMSNYNQADLIEQAINSVLMQKTNFSFQLIITDDNSTKDNSIEIIQKYEKKYPDIIKVLYNKENGRYLKNILRAKAITKTPYFTLLDADDYWTDDCYLQKAYDFLEAHPDFTIYNANVMALKENGECSPYIKTTKKTADFTIENFIDNTIMFSQTTGMLFRNVIFSNGIPQIMSEAVGTISERSFEGDADRYIMHLKYGKAHFVNEISGVYRILSNGIWAGLNNFEKAAIQAQSYLDWNRYYDGKYQQFFVNRIYEELKHCIRFLNEFMDEEKYSIRDEAKDKFFNCLSFCHENKKLLTLSIKAPQKIKYKWMLKIYQYLRKKLRKKGLIDD